MKRQRRDLRGKGTILLAREQRLQDFFVVGAAVGHQKTGLGKERAQIHISVTIVLTVKDAHQGVSCPTMK